jgi:hypothetical protein
LCSQLLPGGSGKVGGDDIGGVPVETAAGTVIAHRRARVGVRGGFLDVAERNSGVEGGGDECVPQRVRPDRLGDPGAAGHPADDPRGAVPIQPLSVRAEEDRPLHALSDDQVDRPCRAGRERDGDNLAALAGDDKRPMPALDAQEPPRSGCRPPLAPGGSGDTRRVLALDGLPEDRETRLSVLYRLRDVIAAACHLDDAHGEGDGALWRRYAARQFAVAISPATVCELVELVAQDEDTERAPPR